MNGHHLRTLAALAEAGSAAGVALTPAGARLAALGEEFGARLDAVLEELTAEDRPAGSVTVTAPGWFCAKVLVPGLPELNRSYPELELRLVGTSDLVDLSEEGGLERLDAVAPPSAEVIWRVVNRPGRPPSRIRVVAEWLASRFQAEQERLSGATSSSGIDPVQ